jgi:hypothetical protein
MSSRFCCITYVSSTGSSSGRSQSSIISTISRFLHFTAISRAVRPPSEVAVNDASFRSSSHTPSFQPSWHAIIKGVWPC